MYGAVVASRLTPTYKAGREENATMSNLRNDLDGFCVHGVYVGGIGVDWMCGWCEDGTTTLEEYTAYRIREENRKTRYRTTVNACAEMFSSFYPADPMPMVSSLASSIVLAMWKSAR